MKTTLKIFSIAVLASFLLIGCQSNPADSAEHKEMVAEHEKMEKEHESLAADHAKMEEMHQQMIAEHEKA